LQDNIDILAVGEEYKEKMEKNIVKMKGMDFMSITVRKATEADINKLKNNPTWGCEVSEFDWHYDSEEICWLTEGEVTVTYNGGRVSFGAGDYVEFPQGLSCVWKVTKPVKKHYEFR